MKNVLGFLILPFLILAGCAPAGSGVTRDENSYFGQNVSEFTFSFESELLIPKSVGKPTEKILNSEIRLAVSYLMGRMHDDGSLYPNYSVKLMSFAEDKLNPNLNRLQYRFSGTAVFSKSLKSYTFLIPLKARGFYQRLLEAGSCHGEKADYVNEGNYWYHWNPNRKDCNLVLGKDYVKALVQLTPVETLLGNTTPEYRRLIQNNQVNMTLFYGMDAKGGETDPRKSKDASAVEFFKMKNELQHKMGYAVIPFSEAEMRKVYNPKDAKKLPFGFIATKVTAKATLRVRLLYVNSEYGSQGAEAFHYFYKNSLEKESVVMYSGHSGLGRNLNLSNIEFERGFKINMNKNYQIIFFESCLSYSYFTQSYFNRKVTLEDPNGTKSLDMMIYGRESHGSNPEMRSVVNSLTHSFTYGRNTTYRQMVGPNPNDFFGVIGDDDNPKHDGFRSYTF